MAWFAVLAIVLQLGAPSLHRAMAAPGEADAGAALGALTALLGPNVALCLHEDGSAPGSPAHNQHDCCADCVHSASAAALLPPNHGVPVPLAGDAKRFSVASQADVSDLRRVAFAQPRAPPLFA